MIASVCAVAVVLVTGCSGGEDNKQVKTGWGETEIVEQMGMQANADDTGWTYTIEGDVACAVVSVLSSPLEVQASENAGEVVAVNPAGSAGLIIGGDEPESCLDAAIELLKDID